MSPTTIFLALPPGYDIALIISGALCMAGWRLWFGGALGAEIGEATGGATSGKTAARIAVCLFSIPAWVMWPWWQALALTVALPVFFSLGQDFNKPLKVAWRYSLPLLALCAAVALWRAIPFALVPTVAAWLLRGKETPTGGPITGWESWWEVALGASTGIIVMAAGVTTRGCPWL